LGLSEPDSRSSPHPLLASLRRIAYGPCQASLPAFSSASAPHRPRSFTPPCQACLWARARHRAQRVRREHLSAVGAFISLQRPRSWVGRLLARGAVLARLGGGTCQTSCNTTTLFGPQAVTLEQMRPLAGCYCRMHARAVTRVRGVRAGRGRGTAGAPVRMPPIRGGGDRPGTVASPARLSDVPPHRPSRTTRGIEP
jgi:hypothetical protein